MVNQETGIQCKCRECDKYCSYYTDALSECSRSVSSTVICSANTGTKSLLARSDSEYSMRIFATIHLINVTKGSFRVRAI